MNLEIGAYPTMANPFLVLGGVAVGVITAGIGVLAVPGWVESANDSAAIGDVAQVATAQGAALVERGVYAPELGELTSRGGSVRVQQSSGVRTLTSTSPDGQHFLAVSRSKSGTYFARLSESTRAGRAATIEDAIIDAGTTISGSSSARVTAEGVPVPRAFDLADVVSTNLFINPGAMTTTAVGSWAGIDGNRATATTVAAPWSTSGSAYRSTWTALSAGGAGSGDIAVGVSGGQTEAGKTYTLAYKIASNAAKRLDAPGVYHAQGGTVRLDGSPSVILKPGVPEFRYVTFVPNAVHAGDGSLTGLRIIQSLAGKVAGDYLEVSDVMLYEGAFDPSRSLVAGYLPPADGLTYAWMGTPNGSKAVAFR